MVFTCWSVEFQKHGGEAQNVGAIKKTVGQAHTQTQTQQSCSHILRARGGEFWLGEVEKVAAGGADNNLRKVAAGSRQRRAAAAELPSLAVAVPIESDA
ncbi:hypothetical protein PanWU01x14_341780 [Parasponia andersonii]|uniref:Uncharacterized protein n=1 Tax=Parasponia andersonii TaxID=3476 RepID=A0A2P5ADZ2_PARAD|nr:hypothetical protein PanWU01x14_341780 [Parasponia andersonii]